MFAKYTRNWGTQTPQSEQAKDGREHILSTRCILGWVRVGNMGALWEHRSVERQPGPCFLPQSRGGDNHGFVGEGGSSKKLGPNWLPPHISLYN